VTILLLKQKFKLVMPGTTNCTIHSVAWWCQMENLIAWYGWYLVQWKYSFTTR